MSVIEILAQYVGVSIVISAACIWLGARVAKARQVTPLRVMATMGVIFAVNAAAMLGLWLSLVYGQDGVLGWLTHPVVLLVAQLGAICLAMRRILQTTLVRAFLIYFAASVASCLVAAALSIFVIRPYFAEAYVSPTNSMAPTLIGWHRTDVCEFCHGELIVPAAPPGEYDWHDRDPKGICSQCRRMTIPRNPSSNVLAGDRFMVERRRLPVRWDVVTFRSVPQRQFGQELPPVTMVMRLVGLPGEEVYIQDGSLWVNGRECPLPAALRGLRYLSADELPHGVTRFGTKENPWRLSSDECCVLADFSQIGSDSRVWGPLPRRNIEGVVTFRYWPYSRFQAFQSVGDP